MLAIPVAEPKRAADFLKQIVRDTGRQMGRSAFVDALDRVLDAVTRPHVQVVAFRSGRLILEIDSAPLFAEFSGFRREELRQALNELLPERRIAELQFRLGGTAHV